jgi:membrane-bound lytic murein transglycosylase D
MLKTRAIVLLVALYAVACASTAPLARVAPVAPIGISAAQQQAAEYRHALEEAYAQEIARDGAPAAAAPTVAAQPPLSIPMPDHRTIQSALQYFTTELKPSIQESLIRSAKYRKLIDRELDAAKLPRGLAFLPVIESAYIPSVTSHSGAHGIWQFMPETAREYGLRIDWWVDERADPERSTRAAVTYLKDLYRQFNDWPLVLAAYNAGPGRVRRAMEATGATSFWQLLEADAVPKETRGYVPTFFATLAIATDPATFGFRLGEPVDVDQKLVEVEGPLSLRFLAAAANVDEKLLRDLNPALRNAIVPPGRLAVHVPAKAAESIAARATTLKNDDANVAICSYTLRDGDSLQRLAGAIGADVKTLIAMNDLRSPDALGAGDSLYLPVRARELGSLLAQTDAYYAVRRGDTLYSIAHSHNLTVEELLDLNELEDGHRLHPGERLRITAPRALTAGGM